MQVDEYLSGPDHKGTLGVLQLKIVQFEAEREGVDGYPLNLKDGTIGFLKLLYGDTFKGPGGYDSPGQAIQ